MDKGLLARAIEEFETQSTQAIFLIAVISVMLGRIMDYAYFQKRWPTLKQAAVEPLVIIFIGALSGVIVEVAGLETAWAIGGVCAGLGSLGAKVVFQVANAIYKKYTGKDACVAGDILNEPENKK